MQEGNRRTWGIPTYTNASLDWKSNVHKCQARESNLESGTKRGEIRYAKPASHNTPAAGEVVIFTSSL